VTQFIGSGEYTQASKTLADDVAFPSVLPDRMNAVTTNGRYEPNRDTISVTFCPPNPKLLLAAMSQRASRAVFGT